MHPQLQRSGRSGAAAEPAFFTPHTTDLVVMADRLGSSPTRRKLLLSFIRYREHLRSIGIAGPTIQWVGGSFVETKPEPGDVDVVTLLFPGSPLPKDRTVWAQAFSGSRLKPEFGCDAYAVQVNPHSRAVQALAYWLGLLSHRRSSEEWKGILSVPLDAGLAKDAEAAKIINEVGV